MPYARSSSLGEAIEGFSRSIEAICIDGYLLLGSDNDLLFCSESTVAECRYHEEQSNG